MRTTASTDLVVGTAMSLGLACAGCSFIFTKGPSVPPDEVTADTDEKCSGSVVAPAFDTVFVGTHTGSAIWGLTQPEDAFGGDKDLRAGLIAADFALAALHLASAAYGFTKSGACQDAKQRAAQLAEQRVAAGSPPVRTTAPTGLVGFTFGMSRAAAEKACATAGHTWSRGEDRDTCSGLPSDWGKGMFAQLRFQGEDLWSVEVEVPGGESWTETFEETREALRKRHGEPAEAHFQVPAVCTSEPEAVECAKRGEMKAVAEWRWPEGARLFLYVPPTPGRHAIRILGVRPLEPRAPARSGG